MVAFGSRLKNEIVYLLTENISVDMMIQYRLENTKSKLRQQLQTTKLKYYNEDINDGFPRICEDKHIDK